MQLRALPFGTGLYGCAAKPCGLGPAGNDLALWATPSGPSAPSCAG